MAKYKTEPFRLWNKAKELGYNFYKVNGLACAKRGWRWVAFTYTFDIALAGLWIMSTP